MTKPVYIEKKKHSGKTDFATLRKEALNHIQAICGKVWTDYNIHDPGITILEQLCYGLTDLMYRASYRVEDLLTQKDGRIDYKNIALYMPEEIFPCRPVTVNDYRKVIFDSVPEVDNVRVEKIESDNYGGLYKIRVRLRAGVAEDQSVIIKVKEKIRNVYLQNRNLCEDLHDIEILQNEYYKLCAEIEVDAQKSPDEILAEVYFKCLRCVAPVVVFYPYDEELAGEANLEDIFTGPLTCHGYIRDQDMHLARDKVRISDIAATIRSVDGVKSISVIYLEKGDDKFFDFIESKNNRTLCLDFPDSADDVHLILSKNGIRLMADHKDIRSKFEKLEFEYRSLRRTPQDIKGFYSLPQGKYLNPAQYYSIANHFPNAYSINRFGIPESAPEITKARARQLKAYLLFFEQVMVDFLEQLENLPLLFSKNKRLRQSFFFQMFDEAVIPDAENLYVKKTDDLLKALGEITGKYDNWIDRRNRLFDCLLAIYGESFSQDSLRHYSFYKSYEQADEELLSNKISFLNELPAINFNRSGGFDYSQPLWDKKKIFGFANKVKILLGLKYFFDKSLTAPIVREGLELVSDEQFQRLKAGTVELQLVDFDDMQKDAIGKFHKISCDDSLDDINREDIENLFQEMVLLKNNIFNESFFRNGINYSAYMLGHVTNGNYQVIYMPYKGAQWCYLASYRDKQKAVKAINLLRRFLVMLNGECEGFHLLEHILLRPVAGDRHENCDISDDFYAFRISIVLPSWTTRFHNGEFKKLLEETIIMNCPSHICPDFLWLDFQAMLKFEIDYQNWIKADHKSKDKFSAKLITFLCQIKKNVDKKDFIDFQITQ